MGIYNKYPYTDFHELNLDWFLDEFKKTQTKVTDLENLVNTFTAFVTNYFDDLDVQTEINNKLDSMAADGTLQDILRPLLVDFETEFNTQLASQQDELDVLSARMDTFASLPSGSTSGNAELLDIRVGADGVTYSTAGNAVRSQIESGYQTKPPVINYANFASLLPDLNSVTGNVVYSIVPSGDDTTQPLNLPPTLRPNWAVTFRQTVIDSQTLQEIIAETGQYFIRQKGGNTWGPWYRASDFDEVILSGSGLVAKYPDFNDIKFTGGLNFIPTDTNPANIPANIRKSWYATFKQFAPNHGGAGTQQFIFSENGEMFARTKATASSWDKWLRFRQGPVFVVAADGSGDFTSVLDACVYAIQYPNATVIIDDGDYDIISEYETKYGSDYFTDYVAGDADFPYYQGIPVSNGLTIIGSQHANIICRYTGSNVNVRRSFSCFNMMAGDGHLIGINADCYHVRYVVHDDPIINKELRWTHTYHRCKMSIDYTNDLPGSFPHGVIGGGLGNQSDILIEDCIFNVSGYGSPTTGIVGYHNCINPNSRSYVVIRNNYFITGTAYITWYGASTEVSECLITGNKLNSAPFTRAENASEYNVVNVQMREWNNTY